MRYLSVCSGVEAATVAWHPLGWEAVGYSEIEKFPSEVLAHHYPNTPNFGDMTKYKEWNTNGTVELLVGGTPCQSFSVAGLRKGLEDPRGNLALVYCGILDKFRPKWFVWENVPGVLSSNGGRDFGSFLGAVAELGYGFAYRVLDAQYFGVPQRRRRVFVVGCLGDWLSPAKVLFERESLCRDTPPSRQKREEAPAFSPSSFGNYSEGVGTLRRDGGDLGGGSETLVTTNRLVAFGEYADDGTASTLKARDYKDHTDLIVYETHPADSRVKEMGEVCQTVTSRWGTGGGNVPLVQSIAIQDVSGRDKKQNGRGWNDDEVMYTLDAAATQGVAYSVGFTQCDAGRDAGDNISPTLRSGGDGGYPNHSVAYGFEPGIAKREGSPNRFSEEMSPTLRAQMGDNQAAVAYSIREDAQANNFSATPLEVTPALQALRPSVQSHHAQTFVAHAFKVRGGCEGGGKGYLGSDEKAFTLSVTQDQQIAFNVNDEQKSQNMAVRRLTPTECERLQGFPDNYTNIPWRGKPESPDAPRYKAMGNSMAVPVMAWIGKRIQEVEDGKA
jgi:DNA (cytosine-5)-methyltransferase 1